MPAVRTNFLSSVLAVTATVGGLLAVAGIATAASAALAAFAAAGAVVANLQTRKDIHRLQERQVDIQSAHEIGIRRLQAENDRLHQEAQRNAEIKSEWLRAKQTAEAALLAKGEFLATMSHEIRTPLNGIIPMLDLIARGPLDHAQQQMLLTATASSQQLLRIVDDILDYSKLEANKLELESTTLNLRVVLNDVMALLSNTANQKGLSLAIDIAPNVRLSVRGDQVRLRQVLSNLVANGIKFTQQGHVHLRLRRIGETPTEHLLRFEVVDTGIGIDEEHQQRLFRSFTQADASTTRLYGGTGLGLAICKRIIDLMGGRIGVESTAGQGATFWFELPMLKVIGDIEASRPQPPQQTLLVSNDASIAQRLQRLSTTLNLDVYTVSTAHEALDFLRRCVQGERSLPKVVLADTDMLRQTVQALHRAVLHSHPLHPPQLIWLTGHTPLLHELRENATEIPRHASEGELRHAIAPLPALPTPKLDPLAPTPVALPPLKSDTAPTICLEEAAHTLDGRHVLLVEDNPVNRLVAERLLDSLGVRVSHAENGEQALLVLNSKTIDIVLLDCQMPVLDGYQTAQQWRDQEKRDKRPRLPVIAMTANAMSGDRQRCLDAGMDDYLSKPVDRQSLADCLMRWLKAPRPLQDSLPPAPPATTAPSAAPATIVPANTQPAAVDSAVLEELASAIGPQIGAILSVFLDDAPVLVAQLQQAVQDQDMQGLREAAHSLKSASANVGARGLSDAARQIETGIREDTLDKPGVAVALLVAEFARVRIALRAELWRLTQTA